MTMAWSQHAEDKVMQPIYAIFSSCNIRLSVDGINYGIRVVWRGVCVVWCVRPGQKIASRGNQGTKPRNLSID